MTPNYLDTRQLEAFVAVVSIGSMTGAAKALGKSQPVITRLIQDLEQDVGFSLLHRNGPRISPSEQGVSFFAQAELFLSGLRTISERARSIESSVALPIEIACIPSMAAGVIPFALQSLPAALFPKHVHLQTIAAESVVQAVIARTADIGIASLPLESSGIDILWIGEVPCVAVVASSDPLAAHGELGLDQLKGRRLIASANPYRLRMRINQALEEAGAAVDQIIDSNATYVSLSLARAGLGVAIVESATLNGMNVSDVTVLPLKVRIPFQWGLIAAAGRPLSATVAKLIGAIEAVARGIPGFRQLSVTKET